MASRSKRSSSRSRQGGSTLYGMLAGLLVGLIVAAAVAFYVTKAPMPFVDKASRDVAQRPAPDPRNAPDPNIGLYGRDGAAGTPASGPVTTSPAPLPGLQPLQPSPAQKPGDDLGSLIASLGSNRAPEAAPAPKPSAPPPASAGAAGNASYFLQVGAFRVVEDAEALRARILMMGLPVELQRAEVNGTLVNRVRVGPYSRLDDMNRVRTMLGQEKIASTVVRQ